MSDNEAFLIIFLGPPFALLIGAAILAALLHLFKVKR